MTWSPTHACMHAILDLSPAFFISKSRFEKAGDKVHQKCGEKFLVKIQKQTTENHTKMFKESVIPAKKAGIALESRLKILE